jgi:hypothetical protein
VSLSLPEIIGPYVTLQMVLWDPLAGAGKSDDFLERFEWYNALMEDPPEAQAKQRPDG